MKKQKLTNKQLFSAIGIAICCITAIIFQLKWLAIAMVLIILFYSYS